MHNTFGIERHPPMQPFEGFIISDSPTDSVSRRLRNRAAPLCQPASDSPDKANAAATEMRSTERRPVYHRNGPSAAVSDNGPRRDHNVRMQNIRAGLAAGAAERVGPIVPEHGAR